MKLRTTAVYYNWLLSGQKIIYQSGTRDDSFSSLIHWDYMQCFS